MALQLPAGYGERMAAAPETRSDPKLLLAGIFTRRLGRAALVALFRRLSPEGQDLSTQLPGEIASPEERGFAAVDVLLRNEVAADAILRELHHLLPCCGDVERLALAWGVTTVPGVRPGLRCFVRRVALPLGLAGALGAAAWWHWRPGDLAWARVPAGEHSLGADACQKELDPYDPVNACARVDAEARRNVHLPAFEMQTHEVTRAEYEVCVRERACSPPGAWEGCGGADDAALPVTCISLEQALRYAAFRKARLPTTEEWESAARAGGLGAFTFGDEWGQIAQHAVHGGPGPLPVQGERLPNPRGIHDLHGNVREYVLACASSPGCCTDEPTGCAGVTRGGSFDTNLEWLVLYRDKPADTRGAPDVGIRLVRDVAPTD